MSFELRIDPIAQRQAALAQSLEACNALTEQYGLHLSRQEIGNIVSQKAQSLHETGRIEFGGAIVRDLIYAFCDSPFIEKDEWAQTVMSLIESFYYFKNESDGFLSDEELIDLMQDHFNHVCQGSLEYLNKTTLSDLCRDLRGRD